LTDVASEMLYPVVPLFLVYTAGASLVTVGLIEGIAEATAGLLKGVAGRLSDWLGRRREFVVVGYAISGLVKPLPGIVPVWHMVLVAKVLDRIGKGLRTAPRDALLATAVPQSEYGRAFGFHRAMDTLGAVLGPVVALVWLSLAPGAYREVFLLTCVPSAFAIGLALMLREPASEAPVKVSGGDRSRLEAPFWHVVAGWALFSLGFPGMAFVVLRLRTDMLSDVAALGSYIVYNAAYAAAAEPIGRLSDRIGYKPVALCGMGLCAIGCALLALDLRSGWWHSVAVPLLVGVGVAGTETVVRAWIGGLVGVAVRGTAFGMATAVTSLAALAAGVLAGWLWEVGGKTAPFLWASAAITAAGGILATVPRGRG
jgi:MFS family permease